MNKKRLNFFKFMDPPEYVDAIKRQKKPVLSFYDYNRTTCGWLKYIFGVEIHNYRRALWVVVFLGGLIYSVSMVLLGNTPTSSITLGI